jgi:hypothetical protein
VAVHPQGGDQLAHVRMVPEHAYTIELVLQTAHVNGASLWLHVALSCCCVQLTQLHAYASLNESSSGWHIAVTGRQLEGPSRTCTVQPGHAFAVQRPQRMHQTLRLAPPCGSGRLLAVGAWHIRTGPDFASRAVCSAAVTPSGDQNGLNHMGSEHTLLCRTERIGV